MKDMIHRAQLKLDRGDLTEARSYLDHVLTSGFENSDLYYLIGEVSRREGKLDQAE